MCASMGRGDQVTTTSPLPPPVEAARSVTGGGTIRGVVVVVVVSGTALVPVVAGGVVDGPVTVVDVEGADVVVDAVSSPSSHPARSRMATAIPTPARRLCADRLCAIRMPVASPLANVVPGVNHVRAENHAGRLPW